jgi:lysophospholipase L1-like esterase
MAKKAGGVARAAFGLGLSLWVFLAPASAQEAAKPASACEAAPESLATPAPLPHVATVLKDGKKLNILIIGSPVGLGHPHKSYPATLERLLEHALAGIDVVIVDRPVSGQIAATAKERMRTEVALARPDLLIWQVGANDALQHVAPDEYLDNLRDGVRWAKENGLDVLLVGFEANPWLHDDREAAAIREATRRVAQEENVLYLRRYEAMQFLAGARSRAEQGDNPFPTESGSECLAEQVAQALVANMVLRRTRPTPAEP